MPRSPAPDTNILGGDAGKLELRSDSHGGFPQFGEAARWLREFLASKGVRISGGSAMDRALRAMTRTAEAVLSPPVADGAEKLALLLQDEEGRANLERFILDSVAGAHLARAIRRALAIDPTVFDGKWHLFSGPDVLLARHIGRTSQRDLMWELYLAAISLRAGDDIRISNNGNPDLGFRVRDVRWGIEGKVPNSQRRDRQIQNVKEAIKQLQKSDIDRGFVAINLTSVVDHAWFGRSVQVFGDTLFTEAEIMADLRKQVGALVRPFSQAHFHEWARPYQKARAIFFEAQTICIAGKTLSLTSYHLWFDLHKPNRAELRDQLTWPHPLDQAMANRFQKAVWDA